MDSALLHGKEIHIGEEYWKARLNGIDVEQIREELADKYRAFSRKHAIHCLCCGNPVKLAIGPKQRFHFRHYDLKECSYSENFQKYERQKETFEDPMEHRTERTILKTILEGKLKPHGLHIEEGYRFRKLLSFVPDYVFRLPNGKVVAIDYITGFKGSKGYATHLAKRLASYKTSNFIPFCFVDYKWFAYEPNVTPFTTLEPSEKNLLVKTEQDYLWDMLLQDLDPPLLEAFLKDTQVVAPFDTKRIVYMDAHNRRLKLMKVLHNDSRTAYVVDQPISIDMEKALTWMSAKSGFYYDHIDEEENRIFFTVSLSEVVKKREEQEAAEQRQLEEAEAATRERQEEVNKRGNIESHDLSTHSQTEINEKRTWYEEKEDKPTVRVSAEADRELTRRMQYLESEAYKRKGQQAIESARLHMARMFGVERELREAQAKPKGKPKTIEEKIREKRIQNILNRRVDGEDFLGETPIQWKILVLKKYNALRRNELDLIGLLNYLKYKGVPFYRKDSLVETPVKEFIKIIGREVGGN